MFITQNQTAEPLCFYLVLSTDHISPATGKSPTVTISKNGAAFASPSGAVSEIGSGWYKVAGNATDSNTLGPLLLHATEASSDPSDKEFKVIAPSLQDGVHFGITSLPNAAAGASGGLPTVDSANGVKVSVGTGTGQINAASGKVPATVAAADVTGNLPSNVIQFSGQAVVLDGNNYPGVNVVDYKGAAAVAFPTNFASLSITAGGRVSVQGGILKNTASTIPFVMTDSASHVPVTGAVVTAMVSKDGGAFAAIGGSIAEIGNGCYAANLSSGDLNANAVVLRFTALNCDQRIMELYTWS